jgi:hypothetical protein
MIDNYKIITMTSVGRRNYIKLLVPYLLRNSHIIDKHIFWINTDNSYDISYIHSLVCRYPDFFAIEQSKQICKGKIDINNIYTHLNDSGVIYIKLNDDICWMDDNAIENLINFRIEHPEYFLIYPMIINSGRTACLHLIMGHLPMTLTGEWSGPYRDYFDISKYPAEVSQKIHECFLDTLSKDKVEDLFINKYILYNYEYIPEHCVCWFGKDFKHFKSIAQVAKYNFLSQFEASSRQQLSCICGNSLISHFSFSNHQKYLMEETNLYTIYKNIAGEK